MSLYDLYYVLYIKSKYGAYKAVMVAMVSIKLSSTRAAGSVRIKFVRERDERPREVKTLRKIIPKMTEKAAHQDQNCLELFLYCTVIFYWSFSVARKALLPCAQHAHVSYEVHKACKLKYPEKNNLLWIYTELINRNAIFNHSNTKYMETDSALLYIFLKCTRTCVKSPPWILSEIDLQT